MDAQTDLSLRWAHVSFGWICRAAAHFMAVNLLIRKYIDVNYDFATTDANGSVSDHSCLKFTAHMIKLVLWIDRYTTLFKLFCLKHV